MKLLRDTWLIFARNMVETLRSPVMVLLGLFQPICYLLLLGPIFNGIASVPGFPPGGALTIFTPGLLVMIGMFGSTFVGFGLIGDLRYGVVERLRVTPVSRLALLLGRALRDVVTLLVQAILLVILAWALGLRGNIGGIALVLVLLIPMGLLTASCSYALALGLKNENALAPMLNFFLMPLLLLSGVILPLSLAPVALRNIAYVDPFSYAVSAARALFTGHMGDSSVALGFLITSVLAVLALFWAARSFRNALA
ncbi:MAG: ABC transporter permease [Ktedonobacteraceae bacterium]